MKRPHTGCLQKCKHCKYTTIFDNTRIYFDFAVIFYGRPEIEPILASGRIRKCEICKKKVRPGGRPGGRRSQEPPFLEPAFPPSWTLYYSQCKDNDFPLFGKIYLHGEADRHLLGRGRAEGVRDGRVLLEAGAEPPLLALVAAAPEQAAAAVVQHPLTHGCTPFRTNSRRRRRGRRGRRRPRASGAPWPRTRRPRWWARRGCRHPRRGGWRSPSP